MQKWAFGMTCVLMVCMAVSVFAAPEMILVKAGSFQIGNTRDDSEGDNNEKPVHRVTLTYDYWIGKYEVTFDEYDVFCDATGKSKPHDGPAWAPTTHWGRGTHPAFNVTRRKSTQRTGLVRHERECVGMVL